MEFLLNERIDAFVRGELGEPEFIEELCGACSRTPDVAWDVLAVSDQYYRQGKISPSCCRAIRNAIARPALERQTIAANPRFSRPPVAPPVLNCADAYYVGNRRPGGETATAPAASGATEPAPLQPMPKCIDTPSRSASRESIPSPWLAELERPHRAVQEQIPGEAESSPMQMPVTSASALPPNMDVTHAERLSRPIGTACNGVLLAAWRLVLSRRAAAFTIAFGLVAPLALLTAPKTRTPAPTPVTMSFIPITALATVPAIATAQRISLDRERYVVRPGERQVRIQVRRIGGASGEVSFSWWTRPSGAKCGADYRGRSPTIERFGPGVTTMTLSIPIIPNSRRKHTELFYVSIGHLSQGAAIGSVRSSVVIIMSRD